MKNGTKVSIGFSQGNPPFQTPLPNIQDFVFEVQPGSQINVFQSINQTASQTGIVISTSVKPNMNIVDLMVGGVKVGFTGVK